MTDRHVKTTVPGREPAADIDLDLELLDRVRNSVVALLAELPRSPRRLRIRVRDIVVELDWATTSTRTAADPVPAPRQAGQAGHAADQAGHDAVPAESGAAAGPRITAPAVGTFYRCPESGADPFVKVGDRVKPGQQVAIIEAMKLMLPVEADAEGVISQVPADDGQPVEYGQTLFALDPAT